MTTSTTRTTTTQKKNPRSGMRSQRQLPPPPPPPQPRLPRPLLLHRRVGLGDLTAIRGAATAAGLASARGSQMDFATSPTASLLAASLAIK